jgi:hypothetical protein
LAGGEHGRKRELGVAAAMAAGGSEWRAGGHEEGLK